MPVRVAVYVMGGHRRSTLCCEAMRSGIQATGDATDTIEESTFREVEHDVCVFYGYTKSIQRIVEAYRAAGKPFVYIDLGYWGRVKNNGHHKVVVNGRHPTAYFQKRRHDDKRAKTFGIALAPWRKSGKHILLAGMGAKASVIAENMKFESFERGAIETLRQHTQRPIVYRPKPSCKESGSINGTIYSPPDQPLTGVLNADCHAVVTHHSNVAVEAIVAGIPAFCMQGVAAPMSLQDLSLIETPLYPEGREQWINDIAYTQWTWTEMAEGLPWRHLKDEGLIP